MASFTFDQTAGTQLPTIDALWVVDTYYGQTFVVKAGAYLDTDGDNATPLATYQNGHGAAQSSKITRQGTAAGAILASCFVNCQAQNRSTDKGYAFRVYDATHWSLLRDGVSLDDQVHSEDVSATFTLEVSISAAGLVVAKINTTTVYSATDGTPLTGGYPGFHAFEQGSQSGMRIVDWTDGVSGATPLVTGVSQLGIINQQATYGFAA